MTNHNDRATIKFKHKESHLVIYGHFNAEEIELVKSKGFEQISKETPKQYNKHGILVQGG